MSKVLNNELAQTRAGTPYYTSPEIWLEKPYDTKCDLWSLGCILFEMTSLKLPFEGNDRVEVSKKIINAQYGKIPSHYSSNLKKLIHSLLKVEPSKRPNCQEILSMDIVKHYISRMNFEFPFISPFHQIRDLIKPIKLPKRPSSKNLHLPKSSYSKEKCNSGFLLFRRNRSLEYVHSFNDDKPIIVRKSLDLKEQKKLENVNKDIIYPGYQVKPKIPLYPINNPGLKAKPLMNVGNFEINPRISIPLSP